MESTSFFRYENQLNCSYSCPPRVSYWDLPPEPKKGLSYGIASFFLVAHMAGAGFLALPKALADAGNTRFIV